MDLSTIEARKALVAKWAAKYGLEIEMVCAVCEQESSWNYWAMRYEPAFFDHYIKPMTGLTATEQIGRATSYGLMQVMGQTAREFGFAGRFICELCDPDTGVDFGCRKLQKCFSIHGPDESGLLSYNGGGNPDYGKEVLARVVNYS
jgi:soluble lytic murein transglycosylase-like protein